MLQRRNPFNEMRMMQDTMDRMWRRFGAPPGNAADSPEFEAWAAPLDVVSDGDNFVVHASLPGVSPENIQVSVEDNVLTIKGETAAQFQNSNGSYLMRERRAGSFHRSLRLPDSVDQNAVTPRYEHGVLTITVPKSEPKRARQFPVQVAEAPAAIEGS